MEHDAHGRPTDDEGRTRYTSHEAAELLGISLEALRGRVRRAEERRQKGKARPGELRGEDDEGHRFVWLKADRIRPDASARVRTGSQSAELVEALRAQIEDLRRERDEWREQARRSDHLLAAALDRIPELEAPAADRGYAEPRSNTGGKSSPEAGGTEEEPRRRSWWREFFGFGE